MPDVPELSPEQLEALLKQMEQMLERIWDKMPPDRKAAAEALYRALRDAIQAARAGGPAAARANLVAIAERLQAFVAHLLRYFDNWFIRDQLKWLVHRIYVHLRALGPGGAGAVAAGAEAAAAGGTFTIGGVTVAGITAATLAALLIELLIIVYGLSCWWDYWKEISETPAEPVGGVSCGGTMPIAVSLTAWDISWGTARGWENLMAKMRKAAAALPCPGACKTGTCTGNPAVMTFDQTRLGIVTYSSATFDVYCECL